VVVAVSEAPAGGTTMEATAAGTPRPVAAVVDIADMGEHAVVRFEHWVDAQPDGSRFHTLAGTRQAALRLVVIRFVVERAVTTFSMRTGLGD
jgi:hypothetical protein